MSFNFLSAEINHIIDKNLPTNDASSLKERGLHLETQRFILDVKYLIGATAVSQLLQALLKGPDTSLSIRIPQSVDEISRNHFTEKTWEEICLFIKRLESISSDSNKDAVQSIKLKEPIFINTEMANKINSAFQGRRTLPIFRQENEMECGATCLTMMAHQFQEIERYHFRNLLLPTTAGSSIAELIRASDATDYDCSIIKTNFDLNPFGDHPFIALTDYHFVVVTKFEKDRLIYNDPSMGQRIIEKEVAQKNWSGYCLIMVPRFNQFKLSDSKITRDITFNWNYKTIFAALSTVVILISASSYIDRKIVQKLLNARNTQYQKLILLLVLLTIIYSLLSFLLEKMSIRITATKELYSRSRFLSAILNTVPFYQRLINPKDILSRFEDLSKYVNNFFSIPGRFASRLLLLLLFCVLLYELSSKFFLILAAATLIQGWVIYRFKNRQIHLSQIQTEKFYGYENILTECLRGLSTLIQMRSLPQAVTRISHKFEEYLKQEENKLIFHGQLGFIVQSVEKISIILTVMLALTLYLSGKLGVGDIMVAITTTVGASDAIINYIIQTAELLDQKILSDRVIGLQTYPSIKRSEAPLSKSTTGNYSIDTRELFFTYPGVSNQPTLENISISLTGPGLHFLCGPSGSGKSTLVQIIAGQFPEGSHQKAISTDNYSTQEILDSCLYLSGDDPVLPESLITNLTFKKSGDHIRLIEYLRIIWNDEHRLLDDYLDRNLVNLSMTMSSGQLQRLLFGRAVYAQPRLLILDECFSSVDPQTEQWIVSHLKEFLPKTLIILISHRTELSIYSDKIIFMRNGKVSSQGTPWEVIKTSDEFMEFFKKSRGIS